MRLNASIVKNAALEWFGELGHAVGHGLQFAPGEPAAERDSFGECASAASGTECDGAAAAGAGGAEYLAGRNGPAGSPERTGRGST